MNVEAVCVITCNRRTKESCSWISTRCRG